METPEQYVKSNVVSTDFSYFFGISFTNFEQTTAAWVTPLIEKCIYKVSNENTKLIC